jgi:hypothetical protein
MLSIGKNPYFQAMINYLASISYTLCGCQGKYPGFAYMIDSMAPKKAVQRFRYLFGSLLCFPSTRLSGGLLMTIKGHFKADPYPLGIPDVGDGDLVFACSLIKKPLQPFDPVH